MSASETLFLTRYFSVMVGELVDTESKEWRLYCKHREMLNILTSPKFTRSDLLHLELNITEHNEMYKTVCGELKPKFHFLLH